MSNLKHISQAIALSNDYGKLVTEQTQQVLIANGDIGRCEECDCLTGDKDEDAAWCCSDCCDAESASELRYLNSGRL